MSKERDLRGHHRGQVLVLVGSWYERKDGGRLAKLGEELGFKVVSDKREEGGKGSGQ